MQPLDATRACGAAAASQPGARCYLNNLLSNRRALPASVVLLAFASALAAQESQAALERRIADLERRLDAAPQGQQAPRSGSLLDVVTGERWVPGSGLTLQAADPEKFTVNLGGQVQAGYTWSDDDKTKVTNSGFALRSTRVRLGGNAFSKDVTYFVQMDPSATVDLVDAWAGWRVHESLNIRLGQQKMRSSLQADTSMADTDLEFVDRSIATVAFGNQRATGALLEGNLMEGKVNWHAGVMNNGTAGLDTVTTLTVPGSATALTGLVAPGAQANQAGTDALGWTVGASYSSKGHNSEHWSEGDLAHSGEFEYIVGATVTSVNESFLIPGTGNAMTINGFGGLKFGNGLAVQGEYFTRDNDNLNRDDTGYYGQVSYTLKKSGNVQWGGVVRYANVDLDGPEATELAAGINAYYHEHNLKTQFQVRNIQFENAAGAKVNDLTSLDLLFTLVF